MNHPDHLGSYSDIGSDIQKTFAAQVYFTCNMKQQFILRSMNSKILKIIIPEIAKEGMLPAKHIYFLFI